MGIRPYLDFKTANTIATSIVHSTLDYSLYINLPKIQINRLQHTQNSLARSVAITTRLNTHTSPLFLNLFTGWKSSNTYNINWFLLLTKFLPPVNLLAYIISSLFKLTIILAPLMLSHLLVHFSPLPLRSQIALSSMPRLISGISFHSHFVNQSHLFMPTSIYTLLHFPHSSPLHSFTLNSKLTFLVNLFRHRSLTIDTSDWVLG